MIETVSQAEAEAIIGVEAKAVIEDGLPAADAEKVAVGRYLAREALRLLAHHENARAAAMGASVAMIGALRQEAVESCGPPGDVAAQEVMHTAAAAIASAIDLNEIARWRAVTKN